MNVKEKDGDRYKSRSEKSTLSRIIEHINSPFSMDSDRSHGVESYQSYENKRRLAEATDWETELDKIRARMMAFGLPKELT